MADVTGTVRETFGGQEYELRLTMAGIGSLQSEYGNNIAGLLDGSAGDIPNFNALLAIVSCALQKGSGLQKQEAEGLADEMLTADVNIVKRVISAAFPEAEAGNVKKPKKAA